MKQKGQVRYAKRYGRFIEKIRTFSQKDTDVFTKRCSGFLAEVQTIN